MTRFADEWRNRPSSGTTGQAQAEPWAAHAWPRPPARISNYTVSIGERKAQFFHESTHGPYDEEPDEFWQLLITQQGGLLRYIESLNPRDMAFYEFALDEFARRLEFFEIPIERL